MMTKEPSGHPADGKGAGFNQEGAALIGTVLAVLITSMIGMVSVNLAVEEINHTNMARDAAVAQHLAEAGADVVMQWFHDSAAAPQGLDRQLFTKRFSLPTGPSFFDAQGRSQFAGTAEHPDFALDAARPADDRLLHDASNGWFRGLTGLGRVVKMKVYGPSRPGLLCSVEVVVSAGTQTKSFSFQLGTNTVPSLPSGVQLGIREASSLSNPPLPPWIHWADFRVKGDLQLPFLRSIPEKTLHAPVSGQSYADMTYREDRWLEIKVGGEAVMPGLADGQQPEPMPANIFPKQDPVPGLQVDQWGYDMMKKQALRHGRYYAMDRSGLLYPAGKIAPGLGLTADEVFNPESGAANRGLIFVDTLDQRPPGPENMGTLSIESEYLEGMVVVNAHLQLKPKGNGRSIQVLSPPLVQLGSDGGQVREPILLNGIHIQGVLYVAGNLSYDGAPRVYGAVVAGGKIAPSSSVAGPFELWYNHDLSSGLIRGLPVVFIAPGVMQEIF